MWRSEWRERYTVRVVVFERERERENSRVLPFMIGHPLVFSPRTQPHLFPHANTAAPLLVSLSVGRSGERREENNEPAKRRPWEKHHRRPDLPLARGSQFGAQLRHRALHRRPPSPLLSRRHCQDISTPLLTLRPQATRGDPLVKNRALECQNMEMSAESGVYTEYNNDYMYDSLQSIQKIRDDILHKERILQERIAQCDMDIQTILSEGMMTPKVVSIVDKYVKTGSNLMEVANSSCFGDGGQSITKRKKLKEALLRQCEELDEICRGANWIFPRYTVVPSVSDGMFHASVRLRCPDFEMTINGAPRPNPREARCSAAANMILELHKKAEEQEQ